MKERFSVENSFFPPKCYDFYAPLKNQIMLKSEHLKGHWGFLSVYI